LCVEQHDRDDASVAYTGRSRAPDRSRRRRRTRTATRGPRVTVVAQSSPADADCAARVCTIAVRARRPRAKVDGRGGAPRSPHAASYGAATNEARRRIAGNVSAISSAERDLVARDVQDETSPGHTDPGRSVGATRRSRDGSSRRCRGRARRCRSERDRRSIGLPAMTAANSSGSIASEVPPRARRSTNGTPGQRSLRRSARRPGSPSGRPGRSVPPLRFSIR
jgi:hypothetical protein